MQTFKKFSPLLYILSVLILFFSIQNKNYPITGDGKEYILMTQSLLNHGTPDLRPEDASDVLKQFKITQNNFSDAYLECASNKECLKNTNAVKNYNYFESKSGKYYSWHFFAYPLLNTMSYYLYQKIDKAPTVSFAFVNGVFMLLAIFLVITKLSENIIYKITIIIATLAPTSFSYLKWNHPESLTYSLIVISLILFKNRNYLSSSMILAISSLQNPPIAFASFIIYLISSHQAIGFNRKLPSKIFNLTRDVKQHLIAGLIIASVIVAPSIYYFINFNTSNLIVTHGFSDAKLISINRLYDFYFDFNQGMILLIPYSMLLVIAGIVFKIRSKYKLLEIKSAVIFITLSIVTAIPCLTTTNWNPGGADVLRYAYWNSIFIIFAYAEINKSFKSKKLVSLFFAGFIFTQFVIIIMNNKLQWFSRDAVQISTPAMFILENYPRLYNPTPEIIVERSTNAESGSSYFFENKNHLLVIKNGNAVKQIGGDVLLASDCKINSKKKIEGVMFNNIESNCKLFKDNVSGILTYPLFVASLSNDLNYNIKNLNYTMGWSVIENGFRWSDGNQSFIAFDYNKLEGQANSISIYGFKYDNNAKATVYLNGLEIYDGEFNMIEDHIDIKLTSKLLDKNNVLRFEWHTPTKPSNGDFRSITFAFQKITFLK
ncbi:hypothetical protein [Pantoea trifolii]|uniref:hypothetical protein n=1 Tax=Candidatus Pantoea symbiotica TaxID=1884370 RepID=UPI00241383EC|nr:hypothetical protein [Pantoea rodasii]